MTQSTQAMRLLVLASLSMATTCVPAAAQAGGQPMTYRGSCDGSAAVAPDRDHFVVADDDRNVLSVHRTGQPGALSGLNLDQFLEAPTKKKPGPDGKPVFKEADIEGAARVGDRIYWVGSHGRDSGGEVEPGRSRLFATSISQHPDGPRLQTSGSQAYKSLREDMLGDPKLAHLNLAGAYAPGKKKGPPPESDNGFNIEGLAATPDGRLLIGFRNPRPGNKAILVPLENPTAVVDAGTKPIFGQPSLLDLEGRGVRSIEWIANTYVIVAGPHGTFKDSKIKPPFALFTWSGKDGDTPRILPNVTIPGDFAPESLFAIPGSSNMMLLSDDGDLKPQGSKSCKDEIQAQKTFRALIVPAPK